MDPLPSVPASAWHGTPDWVRHDAVLMPPAAQRMDAAFVDSPLFGSLRLRARQHPDRIIVSDARRSLTWREFMAIAEAVAARVDSAGHRGRPVALLYPDDAVYVAACLAGAAIGVPMLLLDHAAPIARNAEIMAQAGCDLVITDTAEDAARLPAGTRCLAIGAMTDPPPARLPDMAVDPAAPAFIVTTSGSTGRPKLVMHSQEGIAYRGWQYATAMDLSPDDVFITGTTPVGSYAGLVYAMATLYGGVRCHVVNVRSLGLRGFLDTIRREGITAMRAPPSLLRVLAQMPEARDALTRVRSLRLSGEPSTWDDIALIRSVLPAACRITNSYGSTECTSFSWTMTDDHDADPIRTPAGVPFDGTDTAIITDDGQAAADGEVGELLIRSRFNALGEMEGGAFVPGRLQPDADDPTRRVYPTGDLARRSPAGVIVVLGRKDRMLKLNGLRVEPIEIETVLRAQGGVADAIVLPRTVGETTTLVAFVARTSDAPADLPRRLREALRASLPSHMVPGRVVALDSLPRLASGKVDGVSLLAGLGSGG